MKKYNKNLSKIENDILKLCSKSWFVNPAGIAASSLEDKLKISNEKIMEPMESLVQKGLGKINANVKLFTLSFNNLQKGKGLTDEEIITHIYFPPQEVLSFYYYLSGFSK